jgi:hypothetical protein
MFFDKSSKQAFVFPPKVGTITTCHFLGSIGWKGLHPRHQKTHEWIEKYPSLNDYSFYGFFRDPMKRFESALLHIKQFPITKGFFVKFLKSKGIDKNEETVTYEELCSVHSDLLIYFPRVFIPQSEWFFHPKVTLLDFDSFESELRRITGNAEQPLVRWNTSTDFGRSVITDKVRAFVREYYAADYALAKDRLGKEY